MVYTAKLKALYVVREYPDALVLFSSTSIDEALIFLSRRMLDGNASGYIERREAVAKWEERSQCDTN
jgi:hypothetical protein